MFDITVCVEKCKAYLFTQIKLFSISPVYTFTNSISLSIPRRFNAHNLDVMNRDIDMIVKIHSWKISKLRWRLMIQILSLYMALICCNARSVLEAFLPCDKVVSACTIDDILWLQSNCLLSKWVRSSIDHQLLAPIWKQLGLVFRELRCVFWNTKEIGILSRLNKKADRTILSFVFIISYFCFFVGTHKNDIENFWFLPQGC